MARGQGRVYRRKKSRLWWLDYTVDGARVRESSGTTSRAMALRALAAKVARQARPAPDGPTLDDLRRLVAGDYARRQRRSGARVGQAWRHIAEHFGAHEPVQLITTAAVLRYVDARSASLATVKYEVAILRHAFNLARAAEFVRDVPSWPTLSPDNRRRGFFEREDLERVLDQLPTDVADLVRFLAMTGWRRSEAQGLRWDQVDVEAEVCRIETSKSGEPRTLPWGAWGELAAVFYRRLDATRGVGLVFPSGSFRKRWLAACKAAGVDGRLVHDLRRTAARDLSRAGVPEQVIMQLCGWRTRSVFDRYRIVSERDLVDGLARRARRD